jgi:hypothetical protein
MAEQDDLVTVFRSADRSAREEAEEVLELLEEGGLSPVVLGDEAPGVPEGAVEVRVPAGEAEEADALLARGAAAQPDPGDPSHDWDLETIFNALGATAEVEAVGIRAVLDANGIPNVFGGGSPYPNLRFLVRVPRKYAAQARQVLAEAEAAGPAAAEEAEQNTEREA